MKPSFLLGVDILEWKKARAFYRIHKDRLGQWLSDAERAFVESRPKPHEAFATIFAAKEAAFKAIGAAAVGPEALRRIRLEPKAAGRFVVLGRGKLEVTIRRHRNHVVACCHPSKAR